jgi:hypothetical protein
VAYPVLTVFVVLGTGNHFFLDVAAGALTAVVAGLLAWGWAHWRAGSRPLLIR